MSRSNGNGNKPKQLEYQPLARAKGWQSGLRTGEDELGVNPKDGLGSLKVPLELLPTSALVIQSICQDDGRYKYGPWNWRVTKVQALTYLAAAMRHIQAAIDGQDYDSVTGKPHLGYAMASIAVYLDAWMNGMLIDNRPLEGVGGELMDKLARQGKEPLAPFQYRQIIDLCIAIANEKQCQRALSDLADE